MVWRRWPLRTPTASARSGSATDRRRDFTAHVHPSSVPLCGRVIPAINRVVIDDLHCRVGSLQLGAGFSGSSPRRGARSTGTRSGSGEKKIEKVSVYVYDFKYCVLRDTTNDIARNKYLIRYIDTEIIPNYFMTPLHRFNLSFEKGVSWDVLKHSITLYMGDKKVVKNHWNNTLQSFWL